ncbi:MAG: hypothetical protein WCG80_09780 [Spirochaetales bacterium]
MKTFKKLALATLLVTSAAGMAFAQGNAENYRLVTTYGHTNDQTTLGTIEVSPADAIRAWFTAHGVDGDKIDAPLASVAVTYKDAIDTLVNDTNNRASLTALINPLLKASLVRGETEFASMRIGRNIWTMGIDGPEDRS